jgi:hypothetical protein
MTWPTPSFGGLAGGNQPLSLFDAMFNQVAAISTIPSSAVGTNAISLSPLPNCPTLTSYTEFCSFRFRAVGTSSGAVTAQFNGLGLLPVYSADGVTQITTGGLVSGEEYVITFSQALNAGAGGFFLESPAVMPVTTAVTSIFPPGGRLTFQSAVPVMSSNQLNQQTIFYAPYSHPFVPIYNGSTITNYQYTANNADNVGLSLVMGGSANWPTGAYDLFVILVAGAPTLVSLAWTNTTVRATGLAIFGGFLTNTSGITARSTFGTVAVAANQGTYVGSFFNTANGTSQWQFGGAASGGTEGLFYLYNYYNQVLVNSILTDNGAPYTYTSATVRQARASNGNGYSYIQGTSEKAALFEYSTPVGPNTVNSTSFNTGIGVNSTTAYTAVSSVTDNSGVSSIWSLTTTLGVSSVGALGVNALESGDGSNATKFYGGSKLMAHIWL